MNFQPKVSIVIPVFNGSARLGVAIESCLQQSYSNIEIIVVEDGSTDGGATTDVAKSYGDQIRYFFKTNGGVGSALNLGIKKMSGEYFSWLSHDDHYHTDKIKAQIEQIASLPESSRGHLIVYSNYLQFYEDLSITVERSVVLDSRKCFGLWLLKNDQLHGCTLLLPKTVFKECGLFDETLITTQDYDFWFRLIRNYQFLGINKFLVTSCIHNAQQSKRLKEIANKERDELHFSAVSEYLDSHEFLKRGDTSLIFAKINLSMKRRMLPRTAALCQRRCISALRHCNASSNILAVLLLVWAETLALTELSLKLLLPQSIKLALLQTWRNR